jgi:hypothetical protein
MFNQGIRQGIRLTEVAEGFFLETEGFLPSAIASAMADATYELMPARVATKGSYGKDMRFGRTKWNQWKATVWTAHTVTVNRLIESNKQTNKHPLSWFVWDLH